MSESHPNDEHYAALLELAESEFRRWQQKELRTERNRRTKKLEREQRNATVAGRAIFLLRLEREILEKECRQRIAFYLRVAHRKPNFEMLCNHVSKSWATG